MKPPVAQHPINTSRQIRIPGNIEENFISQNLSDIKNLIGKFQVMTSFLSFLFAQFIWLKNFRQFSIGISNEIFRVY